MRFRKLGGAVLIAAGGVLAASGQALPVDTLRVDLDLVLVPALVTNENGGVVRNLDAVDFRVWEDRVEQQIRYFSAESVPASIGIILDTSNSMDERVEQARNAIAAFLDAGHPEDEYFLIEFNEETRLREDFTGDIGRVHRSVLRASPDGQTALYDAVYRGISKAQEGQNARKVLLIISDGEDNSSRYSRTNMENYIRESGVQIYALGISAHFGKTVLRDLTDLTGGRAVFARDDDDLPSLARGLARDMTSQYVLGYVSSNDERDGAWRELRIRTGEEGKEAPALTVRAKRGYYARSY